MLIAGNRGKSNNPDHIFGDVFNEVKVGLCCETISQCLSQLAGSRLLLLVALFTATSDLKQQICSVKWSARFIFCFTHRFLKTFFNLQFQMIETHKKLRRMTANDADIKFLKSASALPTYGTHFYPAVEWAFTRK